MNHIFLIAEGLISDIFYYDEKWNFCVWLRKGGLKIVLHFENIIFFKLKFDCTGPCPEVRQGRPQDSQAPGQILEMGPGAPFPFSFFSYYFSGGFLG